MPSTTNYFQNLKLQTEAAATAKKAALDAALQMATQAKVDPTTGKISYDTDESGAPKLGSMDVAYKERQRLTGAGAESSGTLRSGQLARQKLNEESAYRSNIMGLKADTAAQKTSIDTGTASKIAEYEALYGKTGVNNASSPVTKTTPATGITTPITQVPKAPGSTAPKKPTTPKIPKYDPRRIGGM